MKNKNLTISPFLIALLSLVFPFSLLADSVTFDLKTVSYTSQVDGVLTWSNNCFSVSGTATQTSSGTTFTGGKSISFHSESGYEIQNVYIQASSSIEMGHFTGGSMSNATSSSVGARVSFIPIDKSSDLAIKPASSAEAVQMTITYKSADNSKVYFYESFDANIGNGGNDGNWNNITSFSSILSDNSGWTFNTNGNAFRCAKLGTSSSKGTAKTPEISFSGDAVLLFRAGAWAGDGKTLAVSWTNGSSSNSSVSMTNNGSFSDYTVYLSGINGKTQITFTGATRFFLDEVMVIPSTYTRTFSSVGNYGTICLPFAVKPEDRTGATFYSIVGQICEKGIVLMEETGSLVAGQPYIFKSTANTLTATYSGDAVSSPVATTGLVGNFSSVKVPVPQGCYVLSNNTIRKLEGGSATVGQNRAYLNLDGVPTYSAEQVKGMAYLSFEETDGILTPLRTTDASALYDLSGRRVINPSHGLYLLNGKKIIR